MHVSGGTVRCQSEVSVRSGSVDAEAEVVVFFALGSSVWMACRFTDCLRKLEGIDTGGCIGTMVVWSFDDAPGFVLVLLRHGFVEPIR